MKVHPLFEFQNIDFPSGHFLGRFRELKGAQNWKNSGDRSSGVVINSLYIDRGNRVDIVLIRIVVKVLGGFWVLRHKYRATKMNSLKKMYDFLYTTSLQSKGSWISLSATFDEEPCFPHGIYGIFISGGAIIGRNCVIFQQVTIGSNTLLDSKQGGAPIIGDNCYIGAGAKIIGNVKVGNNVRLGANTVVYQDVPNNCVVTCGAQRVIQKEKPLNNKFYHKYRGEWVFFDNGRWSKVQPDELFLLERSFP